MSNGSRTPPEQQRPGQETAQPSAPDFLLEQHPPLLPSLPHVGHGARHRPGPLAGRLGLAHPGRLLLTLKVLLAPSGGIKSAAEVSFTSSNILNSSSINDIPG